MDDMGSGIGSGLFAALIVIYPLWKIFAKAGLTPALSLFSFVPGLGYLIVACILAFSDWPAVGQGRPDARM